MNKIVAVALVIIAMLLLFGLLLMQVRAAGGAAQDSCRDNPIVFECYPDFGCTVDPIFSRTVIEMAQSLRLPDHNYRPCRLVIDTDAGRFEVSHPLLYLCWTWREVCGITAKDYATAWRGEGVGITHTQGWLERHIPHYLPMGVGAGEGTEQGIRRGNKILPVGIGYPPPIEFPEPPYP